MFDAESIWRGARGDQIGEQVEHLFDGEIPDGVDVDRAPELECCFGHHTEVVRIVPHGAGFCGSVSVGRRERGGVPAEAAVGETLPPAESQAV